MATEAEIQEEIRKDPWGYHSAVLERSNINLDKVLLSANEHSAMFIANYMGGLIKALKLYSEELRIFRTIESKIAIPGTTKEEIDSLFTVLQEFRANARKEAAAAATPTNPS